MISTVHHFVSAKKINTPKNAKTLFWWWGVWWTCYLQIFTFCQWGLLTYPPQKVRDESLFFSAALIMCLSRTPRRLHGHLSLDDTCRWEHFIV
jgi:hypothetical protein